ncbi:hypothetical protein HYPSUDRAFT_138870 [Hypholoma sublateritium FD-334 SS-4]|uniref:RlpA-like protein double-psi beta-barrel domain-containing protein n=1 Tax=Hypholoma sublateritium (strain FD-334 SS-4) TaxID=945553 RepID=A0A0D2MG56_HYPSF|nr:hypothetical protein HYPSUDRAFT_138870 [Hypholoma sublateritium FD-334 SS-4]
MNEESARSESGFLSGTQTGQATFFQPGLGACGIDNSATDLIAYVSTIVFDNVPGFTGTNTNPLCGLKATVTFEGKSIVVALTGACSSCQPGDLAMSPTAFSDLANLSLGRIDINWILNEPIPS